VIFDRLARKVSEAAGKPAAFLTAAGLILAWGATGPLLDFSDTWQLYANTFTTLVTFLMVFLIQSSQNHDTKAIQIKLNEIICSIEQADNRIIDLENESDQRIEEARLGLQSRKG
jgi:low affinity Fe/Cu permease